MPGILPGEGADHPSVTDTTVIVGYFPPLAVSANRSPALDWLLIYRMFHDFRA